MFRERVPEYRDRKRCIYPVHALLGIIALVTSARPRLPKPNATRPSRACALMRKILLKIFLGKENRQDTLNPTRFSHEYYPNTA